MVLLEIQVLWVLCCQLVTVQHGTSSQKTWDFGPVHFCGNQSCVVLRHCKCRDTFVLNFSCA